MILILNDALIADLHESDLHQFDSAEELRSVPFQLSERGGVLRTRGESSQFVWIASFAFSNLTLTLRSHSRSAPTSTRASVTKASWGTTARSSRRPPFAHRCTRKSRPTCDKGNRRPRDQTKQTQNQTSTYVSPQ